MAGSADLSFLEKMHGKRFGDIKLPNDSGQVDPRLKGTSVAEALQTVRPSLEALKNLNKGKK